MVNLSFSFRTPSTSSYLRLPTVETSSLIFISSLSFSRSFFLDSSCNYRLVFRKSKIEEGQHGDDAGSRQYISEPLLFHLLFCESFSWTTAAIINWFIISSKSHRHQRRIIGTLTFTFSGLHFSKINLL